MCAPQSSTLSPAIGAEVSGEKPICSEALGEPNVRVKVLVVIYTNTNNVDRLAGAPSPRSR